ncbi:MAG: energy transducer TonB [Silvibacterium sp.]|nr:energy transducer TonB [Silvibacterium sp.]
MFDDSLVESAGRIRTRSRWFAIGSLLLEAALAGALILIPFLHPAALPKQALTMMLTAPPPPSAPAEIPAHAATAHRASPLALSAIATPRTIPQHPQMVDDRVPGPIDLGRNGGTGSDVIGSLPNVGTPAPPAVKPEPRPTPGPFRVSAGVAAGHLLAPIQPIYPAIVRETRIQGTVVVEAVISKEGLVVRARVVSGPPMLAPSALNAIQQAHYEPYRLNGEPVEVETTISVIFRLD